MATLNWPGFGITSISPTLDQPSQSNANQWTGTRTVISDPWHGKWSFKVSLATVQGDAAFQAARAFFTSLKGQINTFHLPAVEAPQNANTGVTMQGTAIQGAIIATLAGVTTALGAGNMATVNGQLLSIISVGALVAGAQNITFQPALRAAASMGTAVETAKPYALVFTDSSFTWDIGQWRRYGLTFNATEAVGETDTADPALDNWTGGVGTGGGGGGTSFSFPQLASFTSRSLLAAVVSPTDKQVAYLTEAGREGEFVFSTANLSASVTADPHQGMVIAPAADTTGASGAWRRKGASVIFEPPVVPQRFYEATDPDWQNAAQRAADYLHSQALNTGGGGFYKGSQKLLFPAGLYPLHLPLDINHTLVIEGEGSGQFGPGAGGCSHLLWPDGVDGIRIQGPNSSGNTTVDITTHDGAGGGVLRDLCIEGGFNGATESDHHGLVLRNAVKAENLYIKNWPGEGVKAWAGTVIGFGVVGGNLSTTRLVGVKVESCRGAIDIRGSDANVITTVNCEGYNCRQFGLLDDNAAGSNSHTGPHCASNGIITGPWQQTQCSYSGNLYALKWGGDPTVAPSGTTADTANWFYVGPGAPVTNLYPAWVSTPNTFRAGGDYLTLNSAATTLITPYSEGAGFSQFNGQTLILNPTMPVGMQRGASILEATNDGPILVVPPGVPFNLQSPTEIGVFARDLAGAIYGYIDWVKNGGAYYNSHTGHNFRIDGSLVSAIDASGHYLVGANQVVGARQTGTPADATDLATAITLLNSMKAKLILHGLIS